LKLRGGVKFFEVLLDATIKSHEAFQEITNRFMSFAEDFRMIKLHVNLESDRRLVVSESTDSKEIEKKSSFQIDVSIDGITSDQSSTKVTISLEVYCICDDGLVKVRKVENQLVGEICRTNRRWRRRIKRFQ